MTIESFASIKGKSCALHSEQLAQIKHYEVAEHGHWNTTPGTGAEQTAYFTWMTAW